MLNMYRVDFIINKRTFSTRALGNDELLVLLNGLSDNKIEFTARKEYSV
jgi:hypothetical protein